VNLHDNWHYHVFILFIFICYCYFIFGFYLILEVLSNKSGKNKCVDYILQKRGNLRHFGRLSTK